MGHIVSKEGIRIDPERLKAIQQLSLPMSKLGVRSFFGQINFTRRFVLDFYKITKRIVDMMKGNTNFKWKMEGKASFEQTKYVISNAPTLSYPLFSKDFHLYCYASENTLSAILTQPDKDNVEAPIAFMSIPLKKHELKYSLIEKNACALVRVVKQLRFYILNSHSKVFVPNLVVKTILTQQEISVNKRASWIDNVQEYDLDIKPTKIFRGKGLCKAIAEGSSRNEEEVEK